MTLNRFWQFLIFNLVLSLYQNILHILQIENNNIKRQLWLLWNIQKHINTHFQSTSRQHFWYSTWIQPNYRKWPPPRLSPQHKLNLAEQKLSCAVHYNLFLFQIFATSQPLGFSSPWTTPSTCLKTFLNITSDATSTANRILSRMLWGSVRKYYTFIFHIAFEKCNQFPWCMYWV